MFMEELTQPTLTDKVLLLLLSQAIPTGLVQSILMERIPSLTMDLIQLTKTMVFLLNQSL